MRRLAYFFAFLVVVAFATFSTSCTEVGGGSPTSPTSAPVTPTPLPSPPPQTTLPIPLGEQRVSYVDGSGMSPLVINMKSFSYNGGGALRYEFRYCMLPVRPTGIIAKDYYLNSIAVNVVPSPDGVNRGKYDGLIGGTLINPYPESETPQSCITAEMSTGWLIIENPNDLNYLVVLGVGGKQLPKLGQPVPGPPELVPPLARYVYHVKDPS